MKSTRIVVAAFGVLVLLSFPAVATAQVSPGPRPSDTNIAYDENTQVVLNGRVLVGPDDLVSGVVMFNGTAQIDGTVNGDVVVFNGDTRITGLVEGSVTVFSGRVQLTDGARVTGDLVTGETPVVDPGATVEGRTTGIDLEGTQVGLAIASKIVLWIAASASILLVGILLLAFVPRGMARLPAAFRSTTGATFAWGAALFVGLPILGGLAVVTLVGIPFAVGLFLALFAIYAIGYTVATYVVGRLFVKEPRSRFLALLVGWIVVRLIALVPILGGIAWLVLTIVGLGVIAVAARNAEREPASSTADLGPAPPPPPPLPT
ncbi:MAG: hypothetical protein WD556_05000 [Actinomycetota bacterium]